MPFTPFHLGPGLGIKALLGRRFSWMIFGFSQVAMDLEVLVRIVRGDSILHGFTHTYLGATLIAAASALLGRPVCQFVLDRWKPEPEHRFETWLRGPPKISWGVAIASACVGTYSHVALDSLMHSDLRPFAPFSGSNALLAAVSLETLHGACVVAGVAGAALIAAVYGVTAFSRRP